jgi:hypothetical protein
MKWSISFVARDKAHAKQLAEGKRDQLPAAALAYVLQSIDTLPELEGVVSVQSSGKLYHQGGSNQTTVKLIAIGG